MIRKLPNITEPTPQTCVNVSTHVTADLHCGIRIPIPILIRTVNQIAILYYAELITLYKVCFRFQSQLSTTEAGLESGSESESASVNVNKPLGPFVFILFTIPERR